VKIIEKVTIQRETDIDLASNRFYAWVMFDNHTFREFVGTLTALYGLLKKAKLGVLPDDSRRFAAYTVHHHELHPDTQLIRATDDLEKILRLREGVRDLTPRNPLTNEATA